MQKKQYGSCSDCSSGDETLSGESNQDSGRDAEVSGETWSIGSSEDDCPGRQCHDDRETELFPLSRET